MLVATRDPMPQPGAPDPSAHRHERDVIGHSAPRTARMMGVLQLAGSVLAIPVALGSAYSVYQANFSPDTQCQQLRANIIAMIDKKIDAATRRMLVRRDVETFEKTCGAFDPDAKAAFVTLLAESRGTPLRAVVVPKAEAPKAEAVKTDAPKAEPVKAPAKVEAVKSEAPAKDVARKPELHAAPVAVAKPAPAAAEAEVAARDPVSTDARWLDAVRGALVSHEVARDAAAAPIVAPRSAVDAAAPKSILPPPADASPATAVPAAAPVLPPATAVEPRSERAADPDHPVPPGAIPETNPGQRSTWISNIPFVGQVLDR